MKLYNMFRPYLLIIVAVLLSTLILWLPFILKLSGLSFLDIYKHYDGALYIIPAKTFYQVNKIDIPKVGFILSLPLSPIYFASHLPLYPIFIRIFSLVFGYLKSMLVVNLSFTILLSILFYYILKTFKITEKPLVLTLVLLFLPRFLVVRSVGAPESLFIFCILLSLFFFEKKKYFFSGIAGMFAVATKIPGILLFAAYFLVILEEYLKTKQFKIQWLSILLIPLGLLAVFWLYWKQYGDFFAFFHSSGAVPMPYIFSVFNWKAKWVGTAWLEDVIFYFFLYGLTVYSLKNIKQRSFFYFSLVFYIAILFVQHRDISRYALPLWPMALIAFEKFFTSKKFLTVGVILLLAVYLYAWNFMTYNIMPIADWRPFL